MNRSNVDNDDVDDDADDKNEDGDENDDEDDVDVNVVGKSKQAPEMRSKQNAQVRPIEK